MSPGAMRFSPRPRPTTSTRQLTTFLLRRLALRLLRNRNAIHAAALPRAVRRWCRLPRSGPARTGRTRRGKKSMPVTRYHSHSVSSVSASPGSGTGAGAAATSMAMLPSFPADSARPSSSSSTVITTQDQTAQVLPMRTRRRLRVLWPSSLPVLCRRQEPVPLDESSL
jgi:hypothetical protein